MSGEVIQSVWIILAILGYLLVTCVFTVLSHTRKRAIDIHDRVRQCMVLRRQYFESRERGKEVK